MRTHVNSLPPRLGKKFIRWLDIAFNNTQEEYDDFFDDFTRRNIQFTCESRKEIIRHIKAQLQNVRTLNICRQVKKVITKTNSSIICNLSSQQLLTLVH